MAKRVEMDDHTAARARMPHPNLVVAIGGSAGALVALRSLLSQIPDDSDAAFVVVVHGPPGHSVRLVELLQPYTALSVREAAADTPLAPNTVLVIPPDVDVAVLDSHVRPCAPSSAAKHARVDGVFRAIAAAHGPRAVGIVLTGAGSDGTLGLRQLKDRGGLTIAQDPAEAEWPSMPHSAIDAGAVDLVLPLREMPAALRRYAGAQLEQQQRDGSGDDAPLGELLDLLEAGTGRDFSGYRRSVVKRRAGKRMRVRGIADWPAYLELLRNEPAEAEALATELSAKVTEFFGEQETFERLETDVLRRLLMLKSGGHVPLRVWIVGCSTGEEAYSIGMVLLEQSAARRPRAGIQVFASETSEESLQRARAGFYPLEIEKSVPAARLARFFTREDESGYRVRPELRNLVVFAAHDVVHDFPLSQLDLMVCRGGFIEELKPAVRRKVLQKFHFALRADGVLIVDAVPGLGHDGAQFFAAEGNGGVYRRIGTARHATPPEERPPGNRGAVLTAGERSRAADSLRFLHLELLERHAPASVLVDADGRVLHYSAQAGRFVRLPGGEPRHELLPMLREPLRSAVRVGLDSVERHAAPWSSDVLLVHAETGVRNVVVRVEPAAPSPAPEHAKVVVFRELAPGESTGVDQRACDASEFTAQLESELDAADIEAAKRELRKVNEELLKLDRDNRVRVEQLARISADLEVLLESTGLATLFLDRDLKIVRFTPAVLEIFDARPSDKGRALEELAHRLRDAELVADARRVLKYSVPMEREVMAEGGKWYLLRMSPYRSAPHGLGCVAISLVDITARKKAELEILEADRRKDEFIALLAHELRNPLAPITAGIEILKRRDLAAGLVERVTSTMSRQAAQLVRLIDDLLDVSRIGSGRLQLRKRAVALADIVRDAVAAVRPLLERSKHELAVDVPPEPIMLDADAARLTQVIANVLNNAIRYTPNGGRIELRAWRDGLDAGVTVKDNGIGIEASALPRVFDMFYQVGDPRAAVQGGLGIGLALARSLVQMHGGTITAASEGPDRGSEFTVRLPALAAATTEESATAGASDSRALGGHRVLVVDDNADAAQTLAVLIQSLGANEVHVALSGEEALPLAQRLKPDTVFLDLKMPDMDGYEIAQRLRREEWFENTWLVALTGWGLEEHKRRTRHAGFDQHLTKPADRAALEAILSRKADSGALPH
jgi:two-component system CheB/CheR fusion protein